MSIPIVGQVISLFSTGLSSVFDYKNTKIQAKLKEKGIELEEKQLDAMRDIAEIEFQKYVLENSLQIDKDFRDFITEYEGAAENVHPYVQILRSIIRPIITLWAVGIISYLMFANPVLIKQVASNMELIPDKLWDIFFIVFAFWFGGRAVQHIIDKYTKGRVAEAKETGKADAAVAIEQTRQEQIRAQGGSLEPLPLDRHTDEEKERAFGRPARSSFKRFRR
ncbi:holin (3TMs family) [Alteromonadaceae bacterium 2753L.S.0a.02]|nr:holin (3TMs family) [Alteromonadaceae bacterium 2753L.S.0a.02]